jgi:hypothetical protein
MKTKNWVHAKVMGWGFRCTCDVCRCGWEVGRCILRPKVRDAVASMCRHLADYHGGVDQHD